MDTPVVTDRRIFLFIGCVSSRVPRSPTGDPCDGLDGFTEAHAEALPHCLQREGEDQTRRRLVLRGSGGALIVDAHCDDNRRLD